MTKKMNGFMARRILKFPDERVQEEEWNTHRLECKIPPPPPGLGFQPDSVPENWRDSRALCMFASASDCCAQQQCDQLDLSA